MTVTHYSVCKSTIVYKFRNLRLTFVMLQSDYPAEAVLANNFLYFIAELTPDLV